MGRVLPPDFYDRNVVEVAFELLGMLLVSRTREGMVAGRIVEVEAYLSRRDAACRHLRGRCTNNNTLKIEINKTPKPIAP